ncbi:5-bromo-4-chloroindolyl phosphate hydrolysis family protein [Burkholderia ubonensis]|uniref:5-bromo-4-chloroindolyl phosphate hydrolysis family protein n=1 Tax=Burkholderia ubonensis TaxID=101571 RepID=UPI0009B4076D|nr:5-bromo-4-chloroindolyl phosphate hydrolysis family protein [Burkholderia ubonensis]
MLRWNTGARLSVPPQPPRSGRFVIWVLFWGVFQGLAALSSVLVGGGIGHAAADLVANLGLVDKLNDVNGHAVSGWTAGLALIVGACMSICAMWSIGTLRFRVVYLLIPIDLSFMFVSACANFLPSVSMSAIWMVLPVALVVRTCRSMLTMPNVNTVLANLRHYYPWFPAQKYWIREYVLQQWVTLPLTSLSELQAAEPKPEPEPKTDPAVRPAGYSAEMFKAHLSDMREMRPRLRGSMVEDEWSKLMEISQRIWEMANAEPEKYSLLNHFLAVQIPTAITLSQYFVKLGGLTESNPTRTERMREIEAGLQGLCGQFEKVQNQMVESDLAGLQTTLRLLQQDLKQAEQREARAPSL